MRSLRLTDITLKNLPIPASGQVTVHDALSPLKVRLSAGGSRTFLVTMGSGKRYTIGQYGVVTLSQARETAKRLRAERTLGRFLPTSTRVEEAVRAYLEAIQVRPHTRVYYTRILGWLTGKLESIGPRDINRLLDPLSFANKEQALATFRAFFNWGIRRHYIDKSPCHLMQVPKSPHRKRVLTDQELGKIWRACEQTGEQSLELPAGGETNTHASASNGAETLPPRLPTTYCRIVQLLILTGQRKSEIAHLKPEWLDLEKQTLWLPSDLTKNKQEHTFPMGPYCSSLINTLLQPSFSPASLLFPGRDTSSPYRNWSNAKIALDKACGVSNWTLHDLRRTYRTIHGKIGTPPHIAERLINHIAQRGEVERTYDHYTYFPEMTAAQTKYEEHLSKLLNL